MRKSIVVVGSLNMDLVVRTPRHPALGETILGSGFQTFPGGKGANQAVAAARLGGKVRLIGRVGSDAFGEALIETAAQDGVDTAWVGRDAEAPTGVALITVNESGQNTIVVASGANMQVTPERVRAAEAAFENAALLLLQLECPLAAVEQAIDLAHDYGAQVVLNPAPAQALSPALLAKVDILVPNQTELALLTGLDEVQAGVEKLLSIGVKHLIVTLGEEGALLCTAGQQRMIPAYAVKVVDTVAAGDAFVGGLAVGLSEGCSLEQAAIWGNAAGALAVTRAGAQPSLPRRLELEKFMEEQQEK